MGFGVLERCGGAYMVSQYSCDKVQTVIMVVTYF